MKMNFNPAWEARHTHRDNPPSEFTSEPNVAPVQPVPGVFEQPPTRPLSQPTLMPRSILARLLGRPAKRWSYETLERRLERMKCQAEADGLLLTHQFAGASTDLAPLRAALDSAAAHQLAVTTLQYEVWGGRAREDPEELNHFVARYNALARADDFGSLSPRRAHDRASNDPPRVQQRLAS